MPGTHEQVWLVTLKWNVPLPAVYRMLESSTALPSLGIAKLFVFYRGWNKLSGLKQHRFIILQSWRSEVLKSRVGRAAFLPEESPGENLFPCLFQLLEAPFSIFKVSSTASSSLSLSLWPLKINKEPFHWWARGRVVLGFFSFTFKLFKADSLFSWKSCQWKCFF